jgi:hypothetical protein
MDRLLAANSNTPTKDLTMANHRAMNTYMATMMHLDSMVWVRVMPQSHPIFFPSVTCWTGPSCCRGSKNPMFKSIKIYLDHHSKAMDQ